VPGMAHNHSAKHHSVVEAMTLVVVTQSCKTGCATAERLDIPRKVVPQVTVIQTGAVVLDATSKSWTPRLEDAWSLDSGPPSLSPSASTASYSILRI
jgi:hypothetical protein